ncbi:MAG TPA: inositol monophosphatase family protein [bacterium]|nr:inositol monophosphatase family protein [bacterium]HPS28653.1 inositol monophosphatase family protein [bacterium]
MNISNSSLPLIEKAVRETGLKTLELFCSSGLKKRHKSSRDLVSEADELAERSLISALSKIENIKFLSEEFNPDTDLSAPCWIIDPIDGTTNFIAGIPPYSISVAHYNGNEVDLGVCYLPVTDEMFTAEKGLGAFLNGIKIKVNEDSDPVNCVVATGFADIIHEDAVSTLDVFCSVIKKTRALRRLGSAVADLVYTACGKFAFFYEAGLAPWDVAAGSLIVKEAGGMVTDFYGNQNYLAGKTIIASNPLIYNFISDEIKNYYPKNQTNMEEKK